MKNVLWLYGCLVIILCVQACFIDAEEKSTACSDNLFRPEDCRPVFDVIHERIKGDSRSIFCYDLDRAQALISDLVVQCEFDGNSETDLISAYRNLGYPQSVVKCKDVAIAMHAVLLANPNKLSTESKNRLNKTWRKVTEERKKVSKKS